VLMKSDLTKGQKISISKKMIKKDINKIIKLYKSGLASTDIIKLFPYCKTTISLRKQMS